MYDKTPGNIPEEGEIAENDGAAVGREPETVAEPVAEPIKEERFIRLHMEEVIGRVKTPDAKTAERNAARFYDVPPPGPAASFKELSAYRERAVKAGLPVTAQDIKDYQVELDDATRGESLMACQEVFLSTATHSRRPTPGTKILAQAVLQHNPKLVEHMKMMNMQLRDRRDRIVPEFAADLDPQQRLSEDPERFRADMYALGKMGPLPTKATADDIAQYRAQFRKVGVRLTLGDVETYQKALAEQGTRGLLRPGATNDMPLSSTMLADLHRKPAARELVGADAERFAHILQKRPQMQSPLPKTVDREAVANSRADRSVAQESPYAKWPPLGPNGLRGQTHTQPAQIEGNVAAHEGAARAKLEMTRAGKTAVMHDGYQRTGRIVAFDSGRGDVIQRVNKDETVSYKLADFERVMSHKALQDAVMLGHDVRINVRNGELAITNLSQERGTKFVAPTMPQGETNERAASTLHGAPTTVPQTPQGETRVRPPSGPYGVPIAVPEAPQGPTMVRDGKQQAIPSGYQQTGRLFMVSDGEVFQRIDKGTSVRYPEADVREALGGAEQLRHAVTYGHDVRIRVQRGEMSAANVGLERAQQRTGQALHDRS